MREIKFRAWNSVLHEYRTIDMNSGEHNLGMGFEAKGGIGSKVTTLYRSAGDVIEQYTGLKDFNGVEIYEGDILQDVDGGNIVGFVEYDDAFGEYDCGDNNLYECTRDCQVVGNIHENADLLEEQ
ncbi:YopX family protein [Leuconostoc citreum]|uniref:YopX family protein n=1 Tax=Leuconostoc citreum TaxID=33964 RepID=UPI0032E03833